jgi:hypothetical protein
VTIEHVALTERGDGLTQLRPVAARTALLLREQLRDPGHLQLSNLGVERLVVGRDPAITDDLWHFEPPFRIRLSH